MHVALERLLASVSFTVPHPVDHTVYSIIASITIDQAYEHMAYAVLIQSVRHLHRRVAATNQLFSITLTCLEVVIMDAETT